MSILVCLLALQTLFTHFILHRNRTPVWLAFYRAGVSDGDFGSVLGREVAVTHKHGKMVARLHIISDGFVEHIFS